MVSIIVPIYNAEKYLQKCLQSVLDQSYAEYEAILVDDGSTDGSSTICEQYAEKDARIKVFHKQNGGVSSARNLGIQEARGEFITFVDADDYLAPNYLTDLMANRDECDFVVGGATFVNDAGESININVCEDIVIQSQSDFCKYFPILDEQVLFDAPWNKLFKTSIIKENPVAFDESLSYGEDKLFVLDYLKYVERMRVIPADGYYYRSNGEGRYNLSWKYLMGWCDKCLSAWKDLYTRWASDGRWDEPAYITRFRAHHGFQILKDILSHVKLPITKKLQMVRMVLLYSKKQGRLPIRLMKTKKQLLFSILCWL